jgi:ATP-dependent RNA helicase SUPV3L1/SUV3
MRRLRENTMPEAEISPTGTVLVEGHHVGELQGFRFTADQSAAGEDGKAVKAAAAKALAVEFELRAERFSICANGDLALGSDGILRWIGAPVGTLVASEDMLKPRVILFADEQLTGPARDKVAARAERFVNFQIETLLKSLIELKNADQLTGIARGIAFQLVENFGLINRRDIAADIKTLDQEGRAALRRFGVRFGAYHVFVPALLKPAPAGLVTLLWALGNDGKDKPGFGDVVHALAAGRTSVVIEPSFDKAFYKLAGFRNLGRRAVRVDIVERLADLIRPALAWKVGTGPRPDGAYDGNVFLITPAMMSILGATGEDMEEILKGLGYRAEAKPATEVKARIEALDEAARPAAEASAPEAQSVEVEAGEAKPEAEPGEAPAAEADTADAPAGEAIETPEVVSEAANANADPEEVAPVEAVAEAAPDENVAQDEAVAPQPEEPASAEPAEAEEPKPILLWRPVRFEQRARHRHDNRQRGAHDEGARGAPARRKGGAPYEDGEAQSDRSKFKGKPGRPHREGGRPDRREDRPKGGSFQAKPREERPVRIDPDSPFAKLAALRDQLKK